MGGFNRLRSISLESAGVVLEFSLGRAQHISIDLVVDIEYVEVTNEPPSGDLEHVLDDEDNDTVDPYPERQEFVVTIGETTNRGFIEFGARPSESQSGGDTKSDDARNEENGMRAAHEEELV